MDEQKMRRMDSEERLNDIGLKRIIARMDIKPDDEIMDVGACTGAFSIPLARETKNGQVYALDVDSEPLEVLKQKILKSAIDNIIPIRVDKDLAELEHSGFSNGMDILGVEDNTMDKIFMCTVLHEINKKERFLRTYKRFLKPGGRIFIVEFSSARRNLKESTIPDRPYIAKEETQELLRISGYINIQTAEINSLMYMTSAEKAEK